MNATPLNATPRNPGRARLVVRRARLGCEEAQQLEVLLPLVHPRHMRAAVRHEPHSVAGDHARLELTVHGRRLLSGGWLLAERRLLGRRAV